MSSRPLQVLTESDSLGRSSRSGWPGHRVTRSHGRVPWGGQTRSEKGSPGAAELGTPPRASCVSAVRPARAPSWDGLSLPLIFRSNSRPLSFPNAAGPSPSSVARAPAKFLMARGLQSPYFQQFPLQLLSESADVSGTFSISYFLPKRWMEARGTKLDPAVPWTQCTKASYRSKFPTRFLMFLLLVPEQREPGKFDGNQPQDGRQAGSGPRSPRQPSCKPGTKATFLFGTGLKRNAAAASVISPLSTCSAGSMETPGGHTGLK